MIDQRLISDVHEITKWLLDETVEVSRKYNEPILGVVALMLSTMEIGVDLYVKLSETGKVPSTPMQTTSAEPTIVERNIFKEALEGNLGILEDDAPEEKVADDGKFCREIPGFPGYKCTRDGDVIGPRGVLKPMKSACGFCVTPYVDGITYNCSVQSLIMRTFRPKEWYSGRRIVHLDGNKQNNALSNLAFKEGK